VGKTDTKIAKLLAFTADSFRMVVHPTEIFLPPLLLGFREWGVGKWSMKSHLVPLTKNIVYYYHCAAFARLTSRACHTAYGHYLPRSISTSRITSMTSSTISQGLCKAVSSFSAVIWNFVLYTPELSFLSLPLSIESSSDMVLCHTPRIFCLLFSSACV